MNDISHRTADPTGMKKHFVAFYSPGTFVSESSERPIDSWDVVQAIQMARGITERYGATPFGFRFTTRSRGPDDLDSKVTAKSPMYYLNGEVLTLAQVEARGDPRDAILLANMRSNRYERIVQKRADAPGWMWTHALDDGDVVLP